jgi:hypothetical protein
LWNSNEFPISGDIVSIYLMNSYNNRQPFFCFVGFQTNKKGNLLTDASIFDHCNTKDISLEIDDQRYP